VGVGEYLIIEVSAPKRGKTSIGKVRPEYYHNSGDGRDPTRSLRATPHFRRSRRRRQSMILPEVRRRADATSAIEKFHFRERERRRGVRTADCDPQALQSAGE